jgi:cell division protein FtsL
MVLTITTVIFGVLAMRLYINKFRRDVHEQDRAVLEEAKSYTDSRVYVKKLLKG